MTELYGQTGLLGGAHPVWVRCQSQSHRHFLSTSFILPHSSLPLSQRTE